MFSKFLIKVCAGAILSLAANASFASIVWDYSPAAPGSVTSSGNAPNASIQYYGEKVSFAQNQLITGIDNYGAGGFAALNDSMLIQIWADDGGVPGAILASFTTVVSLIDDDGATAGQQRIHAGFAGFAMLADTTYWIGMAPTSAIHVQTVLSSVTGGDGKLALFSQNVLAGVYEYGDLAFRLEAADVPEPASLALFGLALLGLGVARRRS